MSLSNFLFLQKEWMRRRLRLTDSLSFTVAFPSTEQSCLPRELKKLFLLLFILSQVFLLLNVIVMIASQQEQKHHLQVRNNRKTSISWRKVSLLKELDSWWETSTSFCGLGTCKEEPQEDRHQRGMTSKGFVWLMSSYQVRVFRSSFLVSALYIAIHSNC